MWMYDQRKHQEILDMARETGMHIRLSCHFSRSVVEEGEIKPVLMNKHKDLMGRIAKIASEDGGHLDQGGEADFEVYARYDAYKDILKEARFSLDRIEAVGAQGRHEPTGQLAMSL